MSALLYSALIQSEVRKSNGDAVFQFTCFCSIILFIVAFSLGLSFFNLTMLPFNLTSLCRFACSHLPGVFKCTFYEANKRFALLHLVTKVIYLLKARMKIWQTMRQKKYFNELPFFFFIFYSVSLTFSYCGVNTAKFQSTSHTDWASFNSFISRILSLFSLPSSETWRTWVNFLECFQMSRHTS